MPGPGILPPDYDKDMQFHREVPHRQPQVTTMTIKGGLARRPPPPSNNKKKAREVSSLMYWFMQQVQCIGSNQIVQGQNMP